MAEMDDQTIKRLDQSIHLVCPTGNPCGVNEPVLVSPDQSVRPRAQSPARSAHAFLADWWKQSRKNFIKVLIVCGMGILFGALVVGARVTHGWLHLAMGVGIFALYGAANQTLGAWHVMLKEQNAGPIERYMVLNLAVVTLWCGFALLPILLDRVAGIPMPIATRMVIGYGVGMVAAVAIWLGWLSIARRRPDLLYLPKSLPAWWLRSWMLVGGVVGCILSLDPGWFGRLAEKLLSFVSDILI